MTRLFLYPNQRHQQTWYEPIVADKPYKDSLISNVENVDFLNLDLYTEHYKYIGLEIVSETVFDYYQPFVSEKTLRPIFNKRFFIILSGPGTLKLLQNLGFKTWNHIIDESYDNEKDYIKRYNLILKEIEKFCNKDINEVKNLVKNNKDMLEYNYTLLKNLEEKEIECLKSIL